MGTGVLPCWRVVQGVAQLNGVQGPGTTAGGLSRDVAVLGGCTVGCPCRGSAQLAGRFPVLLELSLCCSPVLVPCTPAHSHVPGAAGISRG